MRKLLHHLFIPNTSNNYRSRLLHHSVLVLVILLLVLTANLFSFVRKSTPTVLGTSASLSFNDLLSLTNQVREQNHVGDLALNDQLSNAAKMKAEDMFAKDYWAHISPDGTTPWYFIKNAGYDYVYAGENLARGYYTIQDVENAWLASPEHKANILSNNYQDVGFAAMEGKLQGEQTMLIVEEFGGKNIIAQPVSPKVLSQNSNEEGSSPGALKTSSSGGQRGTSGIIPSQLNLSFKLDSRTIANNMARIILLLFIGTFILDFIVIEKKKVVRFTGHNLDHIFFLSVILITILILGRGITL